jgi:hypothetical protein
MLTALSLATLVLGIVVRGTDVVGIDIAQYAIATTVQCQKKANYIFRVLLLLRRAEC